MKTIAIVAVLMMLTTTAWADEQDNKPATADEPIVLSDVEMDGLQGRYGVSDHLGLTRFLPT